MEHDEGVCRQRCRRRETAGDPPLRRAGEPSRRRPRHRSRPGSASLRSARRSGPPRSHRGRGRRGHLDLGQGRPRWTGFGPEDDATLTGHVGRLGGRSALADDRRDVGGAAVALHLDVTGEDAGLSGPEGCLIVVGDDRQLARGDDDEGRCVAGQLAAFVPIEDVADEVGIAVTWRRAPRRDRRRRAGRRRRWSPGFRGRRRRRVPGRCTRPGRRPGWSGAGGRPGGPRRG